MESIDSISIELIEDNLALMNALMAFLMFGVALDMKLADFRAVIHTPRKILIGLSSQLIILPLLTFGIVLIADPHVSIGLGLLLIACVPGGPLSNYTVNMGKGNTALSIAMTSIVTVAAVIITPLMFAGLSRLWFSTGVNFSGETNLVVPLKKVFETIVLLILIPVTLGMLINHFLAKTIKSLKRPIRILSLLIFLAFIVGALIQNQDNIVRFLEHVFWIVIIHNLLALLIGYFYSRSIWRLDIADAKAISIETGIQNCGLGLILIFNFFPDLGGMSLTAAWWGVWDMISALALGLVWSKLSRK